jgi:hypothetical protein
MAVLFCYLLSSLSHFIPAPVVLFYDPSGFLLYLCARLNGLLNIFLHLYSSSIAYENRLGSPSRYQNLTDTVFL